MGDAVLVKAMVSGRSITIEKQTVDGIEFVGSGTVNASYEKEVGDHYFKVLGGITREESEQSFMRAYKRFFLSNDLDQLSFGGQDGQFKLHDPKISTV